MRSLALIVVGIFILASFNMSVFSMDPYSHAEPVELDQAIFVNVTYDVGLAGVGGQFLAWGDYDNDGDLDLLVNGARLFRNNGAPAWDFTEVTAQVGISGGSYGTWADWNNDGYLDFYCAGSDKLYKNNGPPNWDFADVTATSNILKESHSTGSGWGDYDNDGDVDLFKIRGEDWNDGDPIYFPNSFWRNEGDGTFTNVTVAAGVDESDAPKYSRGVAWADYNDDGLLDIYISNYRQLLNYLYENNGDGTFTDVAPEKGVADGPPYGEGGNLDPYDRAGHGVGSVWGDYDNDGHLDLWVTNLNHKDARTSDDSLLYHNDGPPGYTFTNMRGSSGIPVKPYVFPNEGDELFVGCAWGDYDSDGDLDLYLPQIYDIDYAYSFLYENNGDGTFTDVTLDASVRVWDTYAGCWADYDNDGDLDLITSGRDSGGNGAPHFVHVFRNDGPQGNWLHIKLKGDGVYSNRAAIGARVTITTDSGDVYVKEVEGGTGPHGHQNSLILEFGFGLYSGTVDIEIRWPQNKVQFINDVILNQVLTINDQSSGDLMILGLWDNNPNPIMGETVTLSSTVKNIGSTKINSADVKFYVDAITPSNQILPTQTQTDILPGEERQIAIDWDTSGTSGSHTLYVKAEIVDPPPITTSNILSRNVYIRSENALPIPALYAHPTSIRKGESVFFDASNSTDDTQITQYYFDFGDGNNSGWTSQSSVTHAYNKGGDFTASVKAKDDDNGISSSPAEAFIEVKAKPVADLLVDTSVIFKGDNVTLSGDGSYDEGGTIAEYFFDFGDGGDSGWTAGSQIKHTYSEFGTFEASLLVKDDDAEICDAPDKMLILVQTRPVASLLTSLQVVHVDETVAFDGSQSSDEDGTVQEYYFDFGNGQNSGWITSPQVNYAYTTAGTFVATLTVKDNEGILSENLQKVEIEVRAYPVAILEVSSAIVYKNEIVEFDGSLSSDEAGEVTEFNFDFGDGETSGWIVVGVTDHTYHAAGYYNATLIVRDDDLDISRDEAKVQIEVRAPPLAVLQASSQSIFRDQTIDFNAASSTDEGGSIVSYFFDFGDGENSGWIQSPQITHQYQSFGEFTVSLAVRDNDLDESQNTAEVQISVYTKPVAILQMNSTIIHAGETVILNASQCTDEDGSVVEYYFDFGDGQVSGWTSGYEIRHLYASWGTYNVTLIVRDNDDFVSENEALSRMEVRSIPKAALTVNASTADEGQPLMFSGAKSKDKDGTISMYHFDFGDGKTSGWISQDTVNHAYSKSGSYAAALKVRDDDGDISENRAQIRITVEVPNQKPNGFIDEIYPGTVSFGRDITFLGHGEDEDGSLVSCRWTSSIDGELSNSEMFISNSLSIGKHTILFMVQDDEGAWSDAVSAIITVKPENERPEISISYPRDNEIAQGTLTITGSADDPDGSITEIEVSIDGGSWSTIEVSDLWSYDLDTSDLAKGEHIISFRAFDGEDYSDVAFLTINIGEGQKDDLDLTTIFGLLTVVVIAVIVLAYLIGRRNKKSPTFVQSPVTTPRTFQPLEGEKDSTETRISL